MTHSKRAAAASVSSQTPALCPVFSEAKRQADKDFSFPKRESVSGFGFRPRERRAPLVPLSRGGKGATSLNVVCVFTNRKPTKSYSL